MFTAAGTLGLAMTLCTTVLVVVNAYLFTQLPYPAADRLYSIRYATPGQDSPRGLERLDWTSLHDVIEHPIAWDLDMFYVLGGENAESVPGAWVTPGFVDGLGIRPALGRGFDASAFRMGSENVVLISHRFWMSRFGGQPSAVGQQFTAYVSDRPQEAERFTVIGVLPAEFWHVNPYTDIFAPLRVPTYPYMARLRSGVSAEHAAARITSLVRSGAEGVPDGWAAGVASTHALYSARVRPVLRGIFVAALLLLLVGCANVAGLVLLRARQRQKEIAVRTALGASAAAIARMLVAEALVLGAASVAFALVATYLLLSGVAPLVQRQLIVSAPGGELSFVLNWRVAAIAAVAGLLTTLLCGLAPLAASLGPSILPALRSGTRGVTEGRRSRRLRAGLISVEVAASLVLIVGATLMLRSVVALVQADLGIRADRVLIAPITLRQSTYPDASTRLELFERMLSRLEQISGAEMVALMSSWPLQQPRPQMMERAGPGAPVAARAGVQIITPAYFTTLGIPIGAGRAFNRSDRRGSEPVAIISQTLARRWWPNGDAIGNRLVISEPPSQAESSSAPRLIVGIANDVRQDPADEDLADVYVPLLQVPDRFVVALVRTAGPPERWVPDVRAAFRDIDPELSLNRARSVGAVMEEMRARPRFLASLLAAFAAMAALVAVVGLYGMIAYAVRQREREIAVRIAVGADPVGVTRLFVREGAVVIGAGLVLGLAVTLGGGRLLESQLFGITYRDPASLALAATLFTATGLIAVWWPARRAASTDPAIALRIE